MKLAKQIKSVILFLAMCVMFFTAFAQDNTKLLCRTWQIDDLKYTQEVPESMKPVVQNWVKEMKSSFVLEYKPDGSYTTKLNDQKMEGTWKFNADYTGLISKGSDGLEKEYKILVLTNNAFSFEAEIGGERVTFIMVPATSPVYNYLLYAFVAGIVVLVLFTLYKKRKAGQAGL